MLRLPGSGAPVHTPAWMLDSGCTHHMHPGEKRKGAPKIFHNYRRFDKRVNVHFGKRGVSAPALGVGALTLPGVNGPVLLPDVLHVPELEVPLFSVTAAVCCRLSVNFWPLRPRWREKSCSCVTAVASGADSYSAGESLL
jgi:hypothetical protein